MLVEKIGRTLRLRRKELGITQRTLADIAELSHNTIYKIERGQSNPTLEVIEKLVDVLGLEFQLVAQDTDR